MRSRDIKPGFFLNEYLAACSPHARLLFIGLWMLADREGRLEDRPKQIEAAIFPYEEVNIEELLSELENVPGDHPFIQRYQVNGKRYIQVVNFAKHQNPHRNEKESVIPPLAEKDDEMDDNAREMDRATREMDRATPEISRATPADILTPDSLTPDSLTPDILIADSLKEASPNGEAQTPLRTPPHPGEQERAKKRPQPEEVLSFPPPHPAGPPHQGKAQRSLRSPPHPAVEVYKRAFFYYPRRNLYSLIAQKVGEDEEDLHLWFQACQSWAAHGWNPRNIAGLLEYYEKRGFLEKATLSRGIPRFSRAAQAAIELAEKYEREEGDEENDGKEKDCAEEGDEGLSSFFKAFAPSSLSHPP